MPMFNKPLLTPKKKYNPATQMKRVQWTKLTDKSIKGSFWEDVKESEFEEIADLAFIEESFAAKKTKKLSAEPKAEKKKKENKIHVIDGKKVQNLGIVIGGMRNCTPKQMVEWVEEMRTDKLGQSFVETMIKNYPDESELRSMEPLKDDANLAPEDRLLWDLSQVRRARARLDAMLFTFVVPEMIDEVGPSSLVMLGASEELRTSKRLARVLKIILLMGNYMNAGSRNQGTHGFKIDFITKLENTKTSDNKSNLMRYLARVMVKNYPDDYEFWDEIPNVERGQRVTTSYLNGELRELQKGLRGVDKELKWYLENNLKDDCYYSTMQSFHEEYKGKVETIAEKIKLMEEKYQSLCNYFVVDSKAYQPEELYGKFAQFIASFKAAVEHNKKVDLARRKEEELERKKIEKAQLRASRRQKKKDDEEELDPAAGEDQRGVMDDLIKSLKTGDAFTGKRKRVRRNADGGGRKGKTNAQEMLERHNATESKKA